MVPSKIPWFKNHDLFLVKEGSVVQVWKCKRTISEALLMKRHDFEYVDDVENYLDLIESMFHWPEDGYKKLVKYISERRLLVNGQGLVIAELPKFSPNDGKMDESVSPLFMWSLDIIALDEYIEHYMVQPIPFRPIQYLEDKNGPARDVQEVELSPNELKLTAELEKEKNDKKALDKEVAGLNIKKKGLVDQVAKLEKDLEAKTKEANAAQQELDGFKSVLEGRVADLEAKNRDLEGKIRQLNAQLADIRRRIAELRRQLIDANNEKDALDRKIVDLQNQRDTLINDNKNKPEVGDVLWWNNNNYGSGWLDYQGLMRYGAGALPIQNSVAAPADDNIYEVTQENSNNYSRQDFTTNCGRNFFCGVRHRHSGIFLPMKVADLYLLGPFDGFQKGRFNPGIWNSFFLGKRIYAARSTNGNGID